MKPYFEKVDASDYILDSEERPIPEVELKSASEAEIRMIEDYFNNSPLSGPSDTISVDNGVIFKIDEKLFAYTAAVKTTVDEESPGDSSLGIPEGVVDITTIKTLVELSEDGSSVKKGPQQTLRDNNLHIPVRLIRASLKDHQNRWAHPGSDAWHNFLDTHVEVANEEKRKLLASADDPRPEFREELGGYLLWQHSLDTAKEKLALDIEAANKQADLKGGLTENKVLAQKMVLEPELFVVERADKPRSQGEVSPVSAKDMALTAKSLQAGEFMKLRTISGAGIYAPNKDVREVALNSKVIQPDESLLKSVRVKTHFSDPEYTDIHIVFSKSGNQYHILAERIDEAGGLVSKNKEALEAVGIEPSILSKNLTAQGVQEIRDFASQLEPFAIRSNMIEGQFKNILAKTVGNTEIPEPSVGPHVSIRQLSDEKASQSQKIDRGKSTLRSRELKDNDLRLLNAISNNYSGDKRIVGGSVAKMTSESGNVDFIVAMQTYNRQAKVSGVMTASLSRSPNSQTLKEGSSNGFKADQRLRFMLQEAVDRRAADPMGYSAIDPAVIVGLDGERVPIGQPKLNTEMLMTQVQSHSPDYVLPGNREDIISKPEYRGDGISSELRNTNSDNDLQRAHAHDLTGVELPDVSASPGMMRPGR